MEIKVGQLGQTPTYFDGSSRGQTFVSRRWFAKFTGEGSSGPDDAAVEEVGVEVDDLNAAIRREAVRQDPGLAVLQLQERDEVRIGFH